MPVTPEYTAAIRRLLARTGKSIDELLERPPVPGPPEEDDTTNTSSSSSPTPTPTPTPTSSTSVSPVSFSAQPPAVYVPYADALVGSILQTLFRELKAKPTTVRAENSRTTILQTLLQRLYGNPDNPRHRFVDTEFLQDVINLVVADSSDKAFPTVVRRLELLAPYVKYPILEIVTKHMLAEAPSKAVKATIVECANGIGKGIGRRLITLLSKIQSKRLVALNDEDLEELKTLIQKQAVPWDVPLRGFHMEDLPFPTLIQLVSRYADEHTEPLALFMAKSIGTKAQALEVAKILGAKGSLTPDVKAELNRFLIFADSYMPL